jgi:hypothetical protein
MSMTFGAILDAVCEDGLSPTRRADAQEWVRFRHAWIWGAANWTFKNTTGSIVFTANSQVTAPVPTDIHAVFAVYDSTGLPLLGIRDIRKFYDAYNTLSLTGSGSPEAYTVVNSQILVGPKGDGTTGLVVYQKSKPSLVNDADATGLPDGFDLALVHGGKAEGYKMTNVPMADQFDADFTAAVQAMENDWLEQVLESGDRAGAYRPGLQSPAWR